jgi:ribosome-binding protein aMBF1 (putative translation factor)
MPNLPARTARIAVRTYLAQHDKNQEWLAAKLRVSHSVLSRVLTGSHAPSGVLVDRLFKLTGIDLRAFEDVKFDDKVGVS